MKTITKILMLVLSVSMLTSCYRVKPDAGQESVLVYKPLFFGHGGVDENPVTAGATWCVFSTDHKEFTVTPITITEEFSNMMPSDNTPISFSANLKCQVQSGNTPKLYEKFGENWYTNSLMATFRTMVRDKACVYKMFDLVSKREISAKLEQDIYDNMVKYAKKIGLPVTIMQVSIGAITPPEQVLNETRNTAAQNQSILTQTARADAELSRKQAEINKAIADRAYQNQMGMTTQEYLQLRQLEIEKEKVEIIKDNKNTTIIFGNAPTTLPIR